MIRGIRLGGGAYTGDDVRADAIVIREKSEVADLRQVTRKVKEAIDYLWRRSGSARLPKLRPKWRLVTMWTNRRLAEDTPLTLENYRQLKVWQLGMQLAEGSLPANAGISEV